MSWLAFMPKMRQLPMRPMSKMQILVCFIIKLWKTKSTIGITFTNRSSFDICNLVINKDIQRNHFGLSNIAVLPVATCDEILGMRSLKKRLAIMNSPYSHHFIFLPLDVIQYFSKFRLTDSILSLELVSSSVETAPATLDTRKTSITMIHFIKVIFCSL